VVGAERMEEWLHLLEGKKVGLLVNQSAQVKGVSLVDTLLAVGVDVVAVFAPEHGFQINAPNGQKIDHQQLHEQIPVYSLYGKEKQPKNEWVRPIDIFIYDIQDVGARFYTYISTLTLFMRVLAQENKPLLVLDRPNPNGHYVDGPVLEKNFTSFVGMLEIPIVHGMTVGELAQMINEENWLGNGLKMNDLQIISCQNYDHSMPYDLPIPPSPNLPTANAIALYPSLCLFEGTKVSVGRGTDWPFEQIGAPTYQKKTHVFVPAPNKGSTTPMFNGQQCFGINFSQKERIRLNEIMLWPLIEMYQNSADKANFFQADFFNKLAGNSLLIKQIKANLSEKEIRASWQKDLHLFKVKRKKYLLYKDFDQRE